MFILERYVAEYNVTRGKWKFYAVYHDKSLLEKMVATKAYAGDFRIRAMTDNDGK